MMKSAWIAPYEAGLVSIVIESEHPEIEYKRIRIRDSVFPVTPTPDHPLRHTVNIGLLDRDDLFLLRDTIDIYLGGS